MTPGTYETRKEQANGTRVRSRADIAKITGAPVLPLAPGPRSPLMTGPNRSNRTSLVGVS
jgi:hypothetical protein